MICNKCKVDCPIEKFDTYFHSTKNKHYTRRICNPCMRIGYREYKSKIKSQQIPVPVIPDGHKQCSDCNEYKPVTDYYLSHTGNPVRKCKTCYKKYHSDKVKDKFRENGGKDHYYSDPDRYTTQEQKDQVFMVMEVLGWNYIDGVWWKEGVKTPDKKWLLFEETNKPKRKSPTVSYGRKVKSGVWNNVDKIVKLIEEGYTYKDVADTFDCSHTTIRTVITKYRNGTD